MLGRMPSAVGYQPTLATEMGELQERIASTKNGSVTSVQAVYVPADDLTDPAPATFRTSGCDHRTFQKDCRAGYLSGSRPAGIYIPYLRGRHRWRRTLSGSPESTGDSAEIQRVTGYHRNSWYGRAGR